MTPLSQAWKKKFSQRPKLPGGFPHQPDPGPAFTQAWNARFTGEVGQRSIDTFRSLAYAMKHFAPYRLAAFTVGDDSVDLPHRTPKFTHLLLVDQGSTSKEKLSVNRSSSPISVFYSTPTCRRSDCP